MLTISHKGTNMSTEYSQVTIQHRPPAYQLYVAVDADLSNELKPYDSESVRHIIHLLDCTNTDFPFTNDDLKALQTIKKTSSLIAQEFRLNYGRFFISTVCGVTAFILFYTCSEVTPLVSALGAGVSGALGLRVTQIRDTNLGAVQKAALIESLFKRHEDAAASLIRLSYEAPDLVMRAAERLRQRTSAAFKRLELLGLNEKELKRIYSPLKQACALLLDNIRPDNPLLLLAQDVVRMGQRLDTITAASESKV